MVVLTREQQAYYMGDESPYKSQFDGSDFSPQCEDELIKDATHRYAVEAEDEDDADVKAGTDENDVVVNEKETTLLETLLSKAKNIYNENQTAVLLVSLGVVILVINRK